LRACARPAIDFRRQRTNLFQLEPLPAGAAQSNATELLASEGDALSVGSLESVDDNAS